MSSITLTLPDMHCDGCIGAVTRIAQRLDPAARVSAELADRSMTVAGRVEEAALRGALARAGFPPA